MITGPAGTGKTRVLATAARIWDGPVFGTATSQNATNELRQPASRSPRTPPGCSPTSSAAASRPAR